ncbi:hypothetical protein GCM10011578_099470 [Streptomyces fuscichromogenes]|uniref:Uncharacterized protein n=1 Tax=Streptomyces fuscichromogenes TaxID=1324013 RepID=A0A917XQS9_9ACTN|nr:hypothetical protein GCM10011578_099470 [Streptomyces fuscichromogenes]
MIDVPVGLVVVIVVVFGRGPDAEVGVCSGRSRVGHRSSCERRTVHGAREMDDDEEDERQKRADTTARPLLGSRADPHSGHLPSVCDQSLSAT